jgi:diketogulonate reductase-like aldo/keto reductase
MHEAPMKELSFGGAIPVLGFGTSGLHGSECKNAVWFALETGYRHIDTALSYLNQREIGEVIRSYGIQREKLFITSKVPRTKLNADELIKACTQTLDELQTEYLDLFLIHWPNKEIQIAETLGAMKGLKQKGLIKAIGVSNFTINHLKDTLKVPETSKDWVEIDNNQVEFHPSLNQKELREFCQKNNISITAYAPLAQGKDLRIQEVREISNKYDKPESQVILNWILSRGMVAIPRSAKPEHIRENFETLSWKLENKDLRVIDSLDKGNRLVSPSSAEFDYESDETGFVV